MAFANRIGEAQRGLATGSANYLAWLQNTAGANELLANAQFIEDQQRNPVAGIQIPTMPSQQMAAPSQTTPQLPNTQVGIIPKQTWVPWDNLPPAPVLPPGAGGAEWSPKLPWKPQQVAPADPWAVKWQPPVPHNEGLYPTQGVPRLSAATNSVVEAFNNVPTNLMRGVNNVVTRPIVNGLQFLGAQPPAANPEVSTNIERAGQAPAPGASLPASGTTGAPPTAGLSDPASALPGPDGSSAGGAGSPSTPASSALSSGLTKAADPYSVPREVRNEALQLSAEEHDYFEQMLMQQRQQITDDTNRQVQFLEAQKQQVAQVNQQKLNRLMADAASAQRTGNIGLMKRLQDQAEGILIGAVGQIQQYDTNAQLLRENATLAYRQNDQDLWKQQAVRAEAEFMRGDPSRMLHIFDAYGYPTRLQDAGGGKFHVITVTGDGKGKRLPGGPYTSEGVSDLFHSMMSDEFRQQQAATQAEQAKTLQDFMFELQKIDYQGAVDMQKAVATELAKGKKYLQQSADDGSIVYTPEDGSGDIIVYNPNPPEIPNSGGLFEPKVSKHPIGQ